jgi:excisionase family DNA binding protein
MVASPSLRRRRPRKPSPPPPPPAPPERPNLSVPEAAAVLGCSESTVWNWLREGKLERVRIGGMTRINRAAVEAYAAQGDAR